MSQKGFTFLEVIVAVGILALLLSIAWVSLLRTQQTSNLEAAGNVFLADSFAQQTKAINGEAVGLAGNTNYGIFFEASRYTLFRGAVYSPSDPYNFVVNLNPALNFANINLPQSMIVFSQGSGEVFNFDPNANSLTLMEATSAQELVITFNKLGVTTISQ